MSLLSPAGLWLLLALLPLGALYLLKVRPDRRMTTALFLWDRIFQDKKASALFSRMRELISLLLMALALASIAFAVARPVFKPGDDYRDLVILIDDSASMSAREKGRSRLDLAKETASNILRNLDGERQAAVASASDRLEIKSNATSSVKLSIEGVKSIPHTSRSSDTSAIDALKDSGGILTRNRAIFISDGSFKNPASFSSAELLKVGSPVENAGLCAFDVSRIPGAKDRIEIFYQIVSSLKSAVDADLTLCHGSADNPQRVFPVKIAPGVNKGEAILVDTDKSGRWLLSLDRKDQFMDDNMAFAFLPERSPVRIALRAGESDLFLSRCVNAFDESDGALRLDGKSPELEVSLGGHGAESRLPVIAFRPEGESPFWASLGEELPPCPALVAMKGHPSVKHAPIDGLIFHGARKLSAPAGSAVVAKSPDGVPLLYKASCGGRDAYVLNMDPLKSEFFLSVAFPVALCSMALDLGRPEGPSGGALPPGHSIPVAEDMEVLTPNSTRIECHAGDTLTLDTPGFYELASKSGTRTLACSMQSPYESLLDNSSVKDTSKPIPKGRPISDMLLAGAILIIALESFLYHRRKAG